MSRPSRSLSPQKERSSCRSNLQPHCDGPEGASEVYSLKCWVNTKMALGLDVFVIFAFLEKCKLDYSILQKFKVTG